MAARTTLAALATGSQLGALGLQPSCSWRGGWDGGASSKLRPSTPPGAALGGKLHCHLPRSTREVTAVPAVLSTVPGTHRGAQQQHNILPRVAGSGSAPRTPCHLHRVPSLGMALSSFFSITHAEHGAGCSQLLLAIPKMWICPVGISMPVGITPTACTPMEHPRHGGSTLAERGQLAAPPRAAFVRSLWAS